MKGSEEGKGENESRTSGEEGELMYVSSSHCDSTLLRCLASRFRHA